MVNMTKTQVKKLALFYAAQLEELKLAIKKQNTDVELDTDGDAVDEIQGQAIHEVFKALSARDHKRMQQIENALNLITAGADIDECDECSGSIGEKRLKAMPGVRTCIVCAEEFEKRSKMFA